MMYQYVILATPRYPDPGGGPPPVPVTPVDTKKRPKKKKQQRKHILPLALAPAAKPTDLRPIDIEARLRHYLLTPPQRVSMGYPMESESHPGRAVIYRSFVPFEQPSESRCSESSSGSSGSEEAEDDVLRDKSVQSVEHRCVRCGRGFFVLKDRYLTTERCVYHSGKVQRHLGLGYSCCNGSEGSPGCLTAKHHVWTGMSVGVNGPFDDYVVTQHRKPSASGGHGVYAIDCEMCYTTRGLELCKISVVSIDGTIVYNKYVRPDYPVVDYNTRFSGITAKDLAKGSGAKHIKEVQRDLLELISADTILIGHGLENDLKALKLVHGTCVDTAVAFPHHFGLPYRRSLRDLVASVLQRNIQISSHDSVEDAFACVQLMKFRLTCDSHHHRLLKAT